MIQNGSYEILDSTMLQKPKLLIVKWQFKYRHKISRSIRQIYFNSSKWSTFLFY